MKKNKQVGEVREEDSFQWKVNFDHYNFHVIFRNISNFHAFLFRNTRFGCKLGFDQRCDPSVHPRYIKFSFHFSFMIKTAHERIPFKNYSSGVRFIDVPFVLIFLFPQSYHLQESLLGYEQL